MACVNLTKRVFQTSAIVAPSSFPQPLWDLLRILVICSLFLGACLIGVAAPQTVSGRIEGVVKNNSGVPIAEALVSVSGPVTHTEMANPEGHFVISGLTPGVYTLSITHPGFVTVKQGGIELKAGASIDIPMTLVPAPAETVVVTASRQQSDLQAAPVAVSVVSANSIEAFPASNVGDLLRSVPGLNVVQTSAREINLASRQASPSLTNSQIALIDGRTIYSDFFNVIFWDLIPINTSDIKQIEVVRGPVSSVWGANAATGAVNIITKTPKEAPGLSFTLSEGGFSRNAGDTKGRGVGGFGSASLTFAQMVNEKWSYRGSAGYSFSDAYSRPTGTIPYATSPLDPDYRVGGGSFSDVQYKNPATKQPKFDLRVDQEIGTTGRISYETGYAGSQGIIQSPIGPFRMEPGSYFAYGRVGYEKGRLHLSVFTNVLDGKAPNLLTRAASGEALRINYRNATYDISGNYARLLGNRHLLNYGGNFRYNTFDVTVAPKGKDRSEVGGFFEDEILLGKIHIPVGFRLDKLSSLKKPMFSPRAAIIFKPVGKHAIRFSYNLAHRSPSLVDNYLDVSIIGGYLPLGIFNPALGNAQLPIVARSFGNTKLKAETLNAMEIGYNGVLRNRTNIGVALYVNNSDHVIANLQSPSALIASGVQPFYSSKNPLPGWPLPPLALDLLQQQGFYLPCCVQTLNYGKIRNQGLELYFDHPVNAALNFFANYSYQAKPDSRSAVNDPFRYPLGSIPVAPRDRFNIGVNMNGKRYLGNFTVNYANKAFWTDTRDSSFYGYTNAYKLVNCTFGVRWAEGKVTTSIKAINLANNDVQQHIFGDILKRRVFGEVKFGF